MAKNRNAAVDHAVSVSIAERAQPLLPEAQAAADSQLLTAAVPTAGVPAAGVPDAIPAGPVIADEAGSGIVSLDLPIATRRGHIVRNIDLLLTPAEAGAVAELVAGLSDRRALIGERKPVASAADAFRWLAQQLVKAQAARAA